VKKNSEFPPGFEGDIKNLAIDFDGVLHDNNKGFYDGTCYGNMIQGTYEALRSLSERYHIVIYTAKAKPSRPLVNGKTGVELVWDWLETNNLSVFVKEVTAEKPRAVAYIDDNAIHFTSWSETIFTLESRDL
jgi:hypothetical protein